MIQKALFATALSLFVTVPSGFAWAQGVVGRLVPEGDATTFGWCQLVQLIQNLINFAIFLGVMATALLFMWAGFLYVTNGGSTENISKAKKIFKAVIWGFVAILGGWLLVDTLMKSLTGGEFGFWNQFKCNSSVEAPLSGGTGGVGGSLNNGASRGGRYSDIGGSSSTPVVSTRGSAGGIYDASNHNGDDIRTYLSSNNVSFSGSSCGESETTGCIDMSKLRENPTQQLVRVASSCPNCNVTVTRGSEYVGPQRGAYTHVNGYMVDIAANPAIDAYFTERLTKVGSSETDFTDSCENSYVRMSTPKNIWRITVWNSCRLD